MYLQKSAPKLFRPAGLLAGGTPNLQQILESFEQVAARLQGVRFIQHTLYTYWNPRGPVDASSSIGLIRLLSGSLGPFLCKPGPSNDKKFLVFVFDYMLPAKTVNATIAKNDIVSWILVIYFSFGVLTAKG